MFPRLAVALSLLSLLSACALTAEDEPKGLEQPSVFGSYLQGRFAAQAFDIPKAEEAFEEVARRTERPQSNRTAFGFALTLGDLDDAERRALRIVEGGGPPDGSDEEAGIASDLPVLTLASVAMRDGKPGEAAAILAEPMQSALGEALAVLLRSAAVFETDGLEAALGVLNQQNEGTFRGLVPLQIALLLELSGDANAAEAAYGQALSAPRTEIAALAYARFLEREGRDDDASAIYRTMLEEGGLLTRAGRMGLTRTGELAGEGRKFRRRAENMPEVASGARSLFALALENFAWLGFEQAVGIRSDDPLAEQRQRAALAMPLGLANLARGVDPDRHTAHYLAALIFGFYGSPEEAENALSSISPESWLYSYARLEASDAARETGSSEDAIAVLRQAAGDERNQPPQIALQLAVLLAAEERYGEADAAMTEAIEQAERLGFSDGARWRYHFTRGAMRLENDRTEGAFSDLERALELAPEEPVVLNHLGYSYVERGEQLLRAFGMIERALELDPRNGAIVDSLGWAHFQRGNYSEAVRYLERAVGLEPADAVITDHLGDAYFMTGRTREAMFEWERVLGLEDGDAALKSAVRRKLEGDFSQAPTLDAKAAP